MPPSSNEKSEDASDANTSDASGVSPASEEHSRQMSNTGSLSIPTRKRRLKLSSTNIVTILAVLIVPPTALFWEEVVEWISPAPPKAIIQPILGPASISSPILLDGRKSISSSDIIHYDWKINGKAIQSIRSCEEASSTPPEDSALNCIFTVPGDYTVELEVTDADGQTSSTSSSVRATCEKCYYGIYLTINHGIGIDERDRIYRELLYGVDWRRFAPAFDRHIVLYDPDSNTNVFAAHFSGLPKYRLVERPTGALEGLILDIPKQAISSKDRAALYDAFVQRIFALGASTTNLTIEAKWPTVDSNDRYFTFVINSDARDTLAPINQNKNIILPTKSGKKYTFDVTDLPANYVGPYQPLIAAFNSRQNGTMLFAQDTSLTVPNEVSEQLRENAEQIRSTPSAEIGIRLMTSLDNSLLLYRTTPIFNPDQYAIYLQNRIELGEAMAQLPSEDSRWRENVEELVNMDSRLLKY